MTNRTGAGLLGRKLGEVLGQGIPSWQGVSDLTFLSLHLLADGAGIVKSLFQDLNRMRCHIRQDRLCKPWWQANWSLTGDVIAFLQGPRQTGTNWRSLPGHHKEGHSCRDGEEGSHRQWAPAHSYSPGPLQMHSPALTQQQGGNAAPQGSRRQERNQSLWLALITPQSLIRHSEEH